MQQPRRFQFAHHLRAVFAPVFLGHPSVLGQRCHLSVFALRKDRAARQILRDCGGLPCRSPMSRHDRLGPKEFRDIDPENFCEKENVLVGRDAAFRFDVRENVARDVAPSDLHLRDERVLCPFPLVAELGHFASDEICVAIHTDVS